ncbi:hypothetical protein GCM10027590_27600 [Nocardiopsis nanhaiensis]
MAPPRVHLPRRGHRGVLPKQGESGQHPVGEGLGQRGAVELTRSARARLAVPCAAMRGHNRPVRR